MTNIILNEEWPNGISKEHESKADEEEPPQNL